MGFASPSQGTVFAERDQWNGARSPIGVRSDGEVRTADVPMMGPGVIVVGEGQAYDVATRVAIDADCVIAAGVQPGEVESLVRKKVDLAANQIEPLVESGIVGVHQASADHGIAVGRKQPGFGSDQTGKVEGQCSRSRSCTEPVSPPNCNQCGGDGAAGDQR
ncbi:hypothetical protein FP2506_16979 [Fulvimarina pelagi HTCC2506]|uniref:Uncharacterized protein n=1 Tax=Fulvimarina pelagi HTCC2506 TaxID=314231 RepID=Q0G2N4_9HYPH|nr:hypothetical protein FP2506_16979 [Fulvimarina pelagi HTCC2506]